MLMMMLVLIMRLIMLKIMVMLMLTRMKVSTRWVGLVGSLLYCWPELKHNIVRFFLKIILHQSFVKFLSASLLESWNQNLGI